VDRSDITRRKAAIFKALGHPTRLEIVESLARREHCVCELVAMLPGSQATTSRHLEVLLEAGMVERRRDGVRMIYALALPCVLDAIPCIEAAFAGKACGRRAAGRAKPTEAVARRGEGVRS